MENYTQEQVDKMKTEWKENELDPVVAERDELLKYKPKQKTEQEIALENKEKELLKKEMMIELKTNQVEDFADFFNVTTIEDLNKQIEKLKKILDNRKVDSSYKPSDHKQTDAFSVAKSNGDTLGMIKALFTKPQ